MSDSYIVLPSPQVEKLARGVLKTIDRQFSDKQQLFFENAKESLKNSFWWKHFKKREPNDVDVQKYINRMHDPYDARTYVSLGGSAYVAEQTAEELLIACKVADSVSISTSAFAELSQYFDLDNTQTYR